MSRVTDEFDSVEEVSKEEEVESQVEQEEEEAQEEQQEESSSRRDDPFADLNMPPPIGEDDSDYDSEEESYDRGPSVSALDAGKRDKSPKTSKLSQKSESFLASMGIGLDEEESEEVKPLPPLGGVGSNMLQSGLPSFDDPLDNFNDPHTVHLDDAPILGGRMSGGFGRGRMQGPIGRATSPRLFAQAAQFPTVVQLRCWKWENGIPVSLGCIDAAATEEDFVSEFFDAMPRRGEGKLQYKIRPIDINGQEMGQEASFYISENHAKVQQLRKMKDAEYGYGESMYDDAPMGGMMERMMSASHEQTQHLKQTLEGERERLRLIEEERAQERVDLAVNTAQGIQALTERMLHDEQQRAERALTQQNQQSEVLMNSLSQIFSQQQSMQQMGMERQQHSDQLRIDQERQRAERERLDLEERRRRDREEFEERRAKESTEMQLKWKEMEDQRRWEREQLRIQLDKEKQEYDRKAQNEGLRWQKEMEMNRMRIEQERLEYDKRINREREELQLKYKMEREESERKERLEREYRDREESRRREELELRQKQIEIQAQRDKEHQERLMQMAISEREQQRTALERQSSVEREARENEDRERMRRHELMMKELDMQRGRDREHSERMFMLQKKELDVKGSGGIEALLPKAAVLLQSMGLEPVDVLRGVLGQGEVGEEGGGDSGGGWMDNLPKILGLVGDVMRAGGGMGGQASIPQSAAMPMIGQDPNLANLMMQQQMVQEEMMRQQQMAGAKQAPSYEQFYQPPPTDVTPNIPKEPTTTELANVQGIPMGVQRNVRKAMRKLVKDLRSASEEKWEEKITAGLMNEPDIYTYITAVTASKAIKEGGADPDLCTRIINALKASSLVPDDLPYGQ